MERYLEARRRTLVSRPRMIRKFLDGLARVLEGRASVTVFGGRAVADLETVEPRDLDVLTVVASDKDLYAIEELVYLLKPRGLPVDIIVAELDGLRNPIAWCMLSSRIVVVHDLLDVE